MKNWERFEDEAVNLLNTNFGNEKIKFVLRGKSDSTVADIDVVINEEVKFSIEVKMSDAQSGQFVVLIENNQFIWSTQNKNSFNNECEIIINHLNENFDIYKDVSSKGLEINISNTHFANWIKSYYNSKNVKYIITKYNDQFVILPLEKYNDYFNINGNIRCKKSGSSNLPNKYITIVENDIKEKFDKECNISSSGKKKVLNTENFIENTKVELPDLKYFIVNENGQLTIKKLGNTNNPTVIFSINSKSPQHQEDLELFKNELK